MSNDIKGEAAASAASAIAKAASGATLGGGATTVVTGLMDNPIAFYGLMFTMLSLVIQAWNSIVNNRRIAAVEKREAEQRAEERAEHEARMRKLERTSASMPLSSEGETR